MEKLKSKLNYYKEKGCNLNSEEVKKILYELENTQADLYEANNRINDLLDIVKQKDKEIDWLVEEIHSIVSLGEFIDNNINKLETKEEIKKYFEERYK